MSDWMAGHVAAAGRLRPAMLWQLGSSQVSWVLTVSKLTGRGRL